MLQHPGYQPRIEYGNLLLNPKARSASIAGHSVRLTPIEYQLLHNLAVAAGQTVPNEQMLSQVWGASYVDCYDYLWVHMCRLRQKLDRNGFPPLIVSERGHGYRLRRMAV